MKDGPLACIYLAGKYRDVSPWHVELNIRNVERVALDVAGLGMVPVCTHTMYRYFDGQITAQFWIDATLAVMRRCDAVLVCGDNWLTSSGTLNEIAVADGIGIPVFHDLAQLVGHAVKNGWV